MSNVVMRAHEATSFPGGGIASLSIPWGFSKGDEDLGGYHLVWKISRTSSAFVELAALGQVSASLKLLYATEPAPTAPRPACEGNALPLTK